MYRMPYYSYNQEYDQEYNQDYGDYDDGDNYGYNMPMNMMNPGYSKYIRNEQYGNAYGNYRGGYAPGRMFMSPQEMVPKPGPFLEPQPYNHIRPLMEEDLVSGWIRGHGPKATQKYGAPLNKFARALLRCGVPKDSIRNMPKELLKKFQVKYCGLCSQALDTNGAARIHYLSKYHAKKQKKWLMKRLDAAPITKETPLKDRNLFCELCDVHITSKQHAESHYSGKAHRAIVEGYKEPRNEYLLLPDLEQRYEQLIERETKLLQTTTPSVKKSPPKVKPIKEGPPQLCCHICKIVVTCSEQMTMHLNGKRHLNKEKQHILRTMSGQVEQEGDKTTYTEETYQEDNKEDADDKEQGDGGDNFPDEQ